VDPPEVVTAPKTPLARRGVQVVSRDANQLVRSTIQNSTTFILNPSGTHQTIRSGLREQPRGVTDCLSRSSNLATVILSSRRGLGKRWARLKSNSAAVEDSGKSPFRRKQA
jgi:hypothetical protein